MPNGGGKEGERRDKLGGRRGTMQGFGPILSKVVQDCVQITSCSVSSFQQKWPLNQSVGTRTELNMNRCSPNLNLKEFLGLGTLKGLQELWFTSW